MKKLNVLLFQQRNWAKTIGQFLAKRLQDEGCRLAALTLKRTTHAFILQQQDVRYDLVINNDEIMSRPQDYLQGDRFSLEEICRELDIDSIWPIVMSLRNHVRSYRDKYYYGFNQNVSDEGIIEYVMAVYKCIRTIYDQFHPDVIIAPNFVALPHIMFNLFGLQHGIKMIGVTDCKVKGMYIFTNSYQDDQGAFFDHVEALNRGDEQSPNRARAQAYIQEFRRSFVKPAYAGSARDRKTFIKKIRGELRPYREIAMWYLRRPINSLESLGITLDYRPPRFILRDHYCHKRYKRYLENFSFYPLDNAGRYVYFPLQFQPEASIDVAAPYFSNQIETARQIAMSLPDDYTLVVKEHPAMLGLRPPSYIEKVARTPNVKLIDFRISSDRVLEGADLVISPNSTTLAEAAFYWKPAIQLGNLGTTLKLPNVFKHTDMTTLAGRIKELIGINLKTEAYETKLENYVAAAYDTGFDFNYVGVWERGEQENMELLWQHYQREIERVTNNQQSP